MNAPLPRLLPDGYRFAGLTCDQWTEIADLDTWAFPSEISLEQFAQLPPSLTFPRTVGVWHDYEEPDAVPVNGAVPTTAELAGMHSSYPFTRFPVPGATMAVSGLTWVGVHPGHRRRGLLSAMIDRYFQDCRDRHEPLTALFAAEPEIYGRFGYGLAATDLALTINRGAAFRDIPGADRHLIRIEHATRERHQDLMARVHEQAGSAPTPATAPDGTPLNRPGWAERETHGMWDAYWFDPPFFHKDSESRRIAVAWAAGVPRGYATFRRKEGWEAAGPCGTVTVLEFVALDAGAALALWRVVTDLDLTTKVEVRALPVDDAVLQLLVNARAVVPKVGDNVWVRVIDVPAALAGRQYAADVDVVVHVTDARIPDNEGHWHLRATAFGPASAERTDAAADLSLDIRELGTAYLGGVPLTGLAAAGQVAEHRPGALTAASQALRWPVAPMCSFIF